MKLESTLSADVAPAACPTCGEAAMFGHPGGLLRHCFACGTNIVSRPADAVDAVLQKVFRASHRHLLESAEPRTYLVSERGLHPQLLIDSLIGVIPPELDVTQLFVPMLDEAETELQRRLAQPRKPGRPTKKEQEAIDNAASAVERLKDRRKVLSEFEEHAGQLVFFYTDAQHRIVRARVHLSSERNDTLELQLGGTAGGFNHAVFARGERARSLEPLRGQSVVVQS